MKLHLDNNEIFNYLLRFMNEKKKEKKSIKSVNHKEDYLTCDELKFLWLIIIMFIAYDDDDDDSQIIDLDNIHTIEINLKP